MPVSIDVVVPSFRLEEKYIVPILKLNPPDATITKFYIVADNPGVVIPTSILSLVDNEKIFLIVNQQNMGAAFTRNIGINQGKGDWILFLDDDITVQPDLLNTYLAAITNHPVEIGFIGTVRFSEPATPFDKALKASGTIDVFSISGRKPSFAWGATANIVVSRAAIGATRFNKIFPKSGGAEDIDFFLKVREQNQFRNYRSLPEAEVKHPWWNEGKPNFKRSFRYGRGSSLLFKENPAYTYYDFLNTTETTLIVIIAFLISVFTSILPWCFPVLLLPGLLIIEFIANAVQSLKRKAGLNLLVICFLMMLRLSYQSGILFESLSAGRINTIGMRFNDDGSFKRTHFYRFNSYKITKWILYPLLGYFVVKHYT